MTTKRSAGRGAITDTDQLWLDAVDSAYKSIARLKQVAPTYVFDSRIDAALRTRRAFVYDTSECHEIITTDDNGRIVFRYSNENRQALQDLYEPLWALRNRALDATYSPKLSSRSQWAVWAAQIIELVWKIATPTQNAQRVFDEALWVESQVGNWSSK